MELTNQTSWQSYPKIWNLGHPQAKDLFNGDVVVQEKIDGSQFSFGVIDGELKIKSKSAHIIPDAPPSLFKLAVETVKSLQERGLLVPNWTYRGEVLSRPKHNVLAYDRVPVGNVILFDISTGYETFMDYGQVQVEGARLGLEVVSTFHTGPVLDAMSVLRFLEFTSALGGQKIEGVVIKNYARFGIDGKTLMGKYVSEAFKEVHAGEWRAQNPTRGDIFDELVTQIRTPARWSKAVQHLRDAGTLTFSPKDIGPLLQEIIRDTKEEESERIREVLFKYAWKIIGRQITHGFPEWYKEQLLELQFLDVLPTTIVRDSGDPPDLALDGEWQT